MNIFISTKPNVKKNIINFFLSQNHNMTKVWDHLKHL
jgi:hypothetical protein